MKQRYLYFFGGMLAALGAPLGAQVFNPVPARIMGQYQQPKTVQELALPATSAPNLVEGRELNAPQAIALDRSADPPILYVADTANHRVLAWRNANGFGNAAMADLVLGQKDLRSTAPYGTTAYPLSGFPSGLRFPVAVAVDAKGNVFVTDGGNNRILRYPAPFAQEGGVAVADLVIGQPDLVKNTINRGLGVAPVASSIRTVPSEGGVPYLAGLAFDAGGNLWYTDAGNHRVLRYPAADVSGGSNLSGGAAALAADLVLGQNDFFSAAANPGRPTVRNDQIDKTRLRFCSAIAFDDSGNLFVLDDLARVLVYQPPFDAQGKVASRILGVYTPVANVPPPSAVNDLTFGGLVQAGVYSGGPSGVFTSGGNVFVADTYFHRIVRYDPVSSWAPESDTAFSPRMSGVIGQSSFGEAAPNGAIGQEPTAGNFTEPVSAVVSPAGEVFVLDRGNNRVLVQALQPDNTFGAATRLLGQVDFPFRAPNLIEGREFGSAGIRVWFSNTSAIDLPTFGLGTVLDTTGSKPRMYIADTLNNRVLGFSDSRRAQTGDRADLVIGQVDMFRSMANSPNVDNSRASSSGLSLPGAVAVDADGNLWVADTGNGRVLRFPRPFDNPGGPFVADLVIGQPDFESRPVFNGAPAPTRGLLFRPSSLAFTPDGHLVVSDMGQHRVLLYRQPFLTTGQEADLVLGQPDYTSNASGNSDAQMNMPMGVAVDSSNRLYVADFLNRRIMVWDQVSTRFDGSSAALTFGVSGQPQNVTVNPRTGQIWVADTAANAALRYPEFFQLLLSGNATPELNLPAIGPRGIVIENSNNVWVVDSANRLSLYVPDLNVVNGMNGFQRLAPALLAQLTVPGLKLGGNGSASGAQLPLELGDLQVTVNGVGAPLSKVTNDAIRLLIPKSTRPTGLADFMVKRVSTGEIVAAGRKQMYDVSPAVMFAGDNPSVAGPARALNADGSANSATKPASSNSEITVYATGFGAVPGLPEDGATGQLTTSGVLAALRIIGTNTSQICTDCSASLDANEPGLWRVKCKLPQVAANGTFGFAFSVGSVASDILNGQIVVSPRVTVNK